MAGNPSGQLGPEAQYQAFLDQGRFMIQRVAGAEGKHVFYPRVAAPGSGNRDLEWIEASGFGTVYAITVNRSRSGAYNVALIELDEGPRMMSRVTDVESAPIGTRVKARIDEIDGQKAVVFDVISGS